MDIFFFINVYNARHKKKDLIKKNYKKSIEEYN